MAQVVSASAAETNVVLPRTPSQDAMNNVIEQAPSQASVGAAVPQPGPATPEEMAKEVTWHDHHGMDLTQVREFEPSEGSDSDDEGMERRPRSGGGCCIIS